MPILTTLFNIERESIAKLLGIETQEQMVSVLYSLPSVVREWEATCLKKADHERFSIISDPNYLCNITNSVPKVPVLLSGRLYDLVPLENKILSGGKDPFSKTENAYLCQIQPCLTFFDQAEKHLAERPVATLSP